MGSGSSTNKPQDEKYARIPVAVRSKEEIPKRVIVGGKPLDQQRKSLPAVAYSASENLSRDIASREQDLLLSMKFVKDSKTDLEKEDREMEELLQQHETQLKERKMASQSSNKELGSEMASKPIHPTLSVDSQPQTRSSNGNTNWPFETAAAEAKTPVKQISPNTATAPTAAPTFALRTTSQESNLGISVDAPKDKKDTSNYWAFAVADYVPQTTPSIPALAPKPAQEPSNYWSFNVVSQGGGQTRTNVKPKVDPNEFFASLQVQADKLGVRRG